MPSIKNSLLAILSAILLTLAFPDFEFWFLAWFGLAPLFCAIKSEKESPVKSFVVGWIFGICFFLGTCWWLTFAPINYGGVPTVIAYFLLFGATTIVGLFPAVFSLAFSLSLKRFGKGAIFSAPVLWTAIEFLRFYATGNNWNAVGYSQAFRINTIQLASIGGIYLVGFWCVFLSSYVSYKIALLSQPKVTRRDWIISSGVILLIALVFSAVEFSEINSRPHSRENASVVAIQPNVPMSGLKYEDRKWLQRRHVQLAEDALRTINGQRTIGKDRTIVIFPESPMNFEYERDREFQQFLRDFTTKNNVSVLFNAAEPALGDGLYNSAVLVDERGAKIAQYDKIHLVPFGEYAPVPEPLAALVPTMVGSFEGGKSYDLVPFGDAQAGIMICFESHFPTLSREFARQGADVLVELTNDGYLGETPVLRQHLANAVFRAVETNRPVLRVTNVGITAYIDENGKIYDETKPYTEDTRMWAVKKSNAPPTFYVKYGDWLAWACSIVSMILLVFTFSRKKTSNL